MRRATLGRIIGSLRSDERHEMTTAGEAQTGTREEATAPDRDELYGAYLLASDVRRALADVRVAFLLTDSAYEHVVAKMLGIPQGKQSVLVKLLVTSALATVLGGYAARHAARLSRLRPSGVDMVIGGSALNTALRGIAGAPSQEIPAAGALIGLAMLVHGIRRGMRSAAARSSRDVHAAVLGAEVRYGHHPSTSVAADRTAGP
jgi:hypothetical protein